MYSEATLTAANRATATAKYLGDVSNSRRFAIGYVCFTAHLVYRSEHGQRLDVDIPLGTDDRRPMHVQPASVPIGKPLPRFRTQYFK